MSHKPGVRLPLLSARLQLPPQPLRGCLVNRGTMGVDSLPRTVTRQRRGCDLNPGPSALTTRLPSHPVAMSAKGKPVKLLHENKRTVGAYVHNRQLKYGISASHLPPKNPPSSTTAISFSTPCTHQCGDDIPDGSWTCSGSKSVRGRVRRQHMAKLQAASVPIA